MIKFGTKSSNIMKEKLGFGELKLKFVVIVFAKNRGFPNRSNGSTIHHQFINIIIDVERCFNALHTILVISVVSVIVLSLLFPS